MSFNVQSIKDPDKTFDINNGGWSEIAERCVKVAPELMRKIKYLYTNDGDGLCAEDSVSLAALLEEGLAQCQIDDPHNLVSDFIPFLKDSGGFKLW